MFDSYKHENFSARFRNPFAQVVAYEAEKNIRDLVPTLLSGYFSKNALFSNQGDDRDVNVDEATIEN